MPNPNVEKVIAPKRRGRSWQNAERPAASEPLPPLTHALDDLDALLVNIAEHSGWDRSMDMEEKLYAAMDRLGRSPGIGHLRTDLIPHEVYFDHAKPYLILYRRDTLPIYILAIVHGSRDVATIMRDRLT